MYISSYNFLFSRSYARIYILINRNKVLQYIQVESRHSAYLRQTRIRSKARRYRHICRKKGAAFPTTSFPRSRFYPPANPTGWIGRKTLALTRPPPALARSSLPRPSPRPMKEETSCGSGSIFRVRWCNKKQSSQRGVDRRWRGRPRLVRRVDDQPLSPRSPVSLFIPCCSRPPFIGIICLIGTCISKFAEGFFFYTRVCLVRISIFYLRDCYVWCFNYSIFCHNRSIHICS